jgi:hypothetical protein
MREPVDVDPELSDVPLGFQSQPKPRSDIDTARSARRRGAKLTALGSPTPQAYALRVEDETALKLIAAGILATVISGLLGFCQSPHSDAPEGCSNYYECDVVSPVDP